MSCVIPKGAKSFGCKVSITSLPHVAARGCSDVIWGTLRKSPGIYVFKLSICIATIFWIWIPCWAVGGLIAASGTDGPCRLKPITFTPLTWPD